MLNSPLGVWLKRRFDSNDFAWTLPLPFWAGSRARHVRRFRKLARRVLRRRLVAERGWGVVLAQSLAWPAMAGLKAWLASRHFAGSGVRPLVRVQMAFDLWWVQLAHNIRIRDQQTLAFGSPEQRARASLSIPCFEHQVLMDLINRTTARPEGEEKRGFARFCAAHDLPTPQVLAESDSREFVQFHPLPPAELFLKPADLLCGKGISTLPYDAARDRWVGMRGELLTAVEVPAYATRVQGTHPWVLQRRLSNGPAWARWSTGALCTVRVVTGRATPGGPVEVVGGFMRFPQGNAIVDNRSAGALSADYDCETGQLDPARDPARPWITVAAHPDTHAVIAGEFIPHWDRVRALALRAHAPISHIAMIGWDVALPGDEPMLIEMNLNWDVFTNTPLGCTRYVDILHRWIDTPTPEVAEFMAAVLSA